MTRRLLTYGPGAWLVEHTDPAALAAAIRVRARGDLVEVVPGANTTLVVAAAGAETAAIEGWLAELAGRTFTNDVAPVDDPIEIPVVYDGEDLAAVAQAAGMSVDDVVARHAGAEYRCAFCGFAPACRASAT